MPTLDKNVSLINKKFFISKTRHFSGPFYSSWCWLL